MRKTSVIGALLLLIVASSGWTSPPGRAVWPPASAQLSDDHVPPGSELERFVLANQDVELLSPEEHPGDKVGLPLWMRVHWHKAHPEQPYHKGDPTGGYPRFLKTIYASMVADLQPQGTNAGQPEVDASAGPDFRISGLQSTPRSESSIRIDPGNPSRIIAGSNVINGGGSTRQAQFFSSDGGATWGQTLLPLTSGDTDHGDPGVDWTTDGSGWAMTLGIVSANQISLRSFRSLDGGATWTLSGTPSGTQTTVDKGMLWVDKSATSPFKDNLYAIWRNGNDAFVSRRVGPGGSWQTPLQVDGTESVGAPIGADIKTNANGDVFALWPATGTVSGVNAKIISRKSTNGGASFLTATVVASTFGTFTIKIPAQANREALIYTSAGAFRNASKNLVYVTWMDLTGATGCLRPADEPGTNVASPCKTRIWFARSTDGGASWGAPAMINNDAAVNDQFAQWLSVDDVTGTLSVAYYRTGTGNPGRKLTDVYYQSSYDDGVTWGAPLKVTTAQSDETSPTADPNNQYGDYNGLSCYAAACFPSWTDHRNNAKEEIWSAHVSDSALPAPTNLLATVVSATQVNLSWDAVPGADHYELQRSSNNTPYTLLSSPVGPSYVDSAVGPGIVTYLYRVQAVTAGGAKSGYSNVDLATTIVFADDPLAAGSTTVKTTHITQLRSAVNSVRTAAGLPPFNGWTDPTLTAGQTLIKALHVQELRDQLQPARVALGFVDPPFTDPSLSGLPIKAIHVSQIRDRVRHHP